MTINHCIVRSFWHILLIIYMSMCQEIAFSIINQQRIGFHDWEVEEHLIHLSITIASNSNYLVSQIIQSFHNPFRINTFWDSVTRTIVDDVTHDTHHITLFLLKEIENFFQGWQAAMNI